ncbi:nucleotidyltransferase family protein [Vineibacter terrae]|uniref:nucleotidyltransferase family protein n=1 Tax=Vineibacter terrae TaxID=2586908 RepID=UPI002E368945|nr:nucleotidyltransferase family protein [Vineibacter terrae]HEX2888393.1 nucleotidyltransferase family protein [Vineibacter terrae]
MTSRRFTALVLAGSRGAADPVAQATGVPHKALAVVGGEPMLLRVVDALRASPAIDRIVLAVQDQAIVDAVPALAAAVTRGEIAVMPTQASPALTVEAAMRSLPDAFPLLVTTSDHALLTPDIVGSFVAGVAPDADVAVGLATRTAILKAYPASVRTFIRLGGEGYSGCNLFAFLSPEGAQAVLFWVRMERYRKTPWKIAASIGLWPLLRYALGWLDLGGAFRELSRLVGARGVPVVLPQPEAAIDVDKPSDLAQVEAILSRRR